MHFRVLYALLLEANTSNRYYTRNTILYVIYKYNDVNN